MATTRVCDKCKQEVCKLVPVWPEPHTPDNKEICEECANALTGLIRLSLKLEVPV